MDKLWSRKSRVHGHGKTVESSWPPRGHVLWTVPDAAGKLPGCCADAAPDATPDAARTAAAIAKSFANHRANIGADIHRRLVRCFLLTAGIRLGSSPAIARMIHRMLRGCFGGHYGGRCAGRHAGHCAVVTRLAALFFDKGMVSNQNTGFPIPESRQRFRSIEHLNLMRP